MKTVAIAPYLILACSFAASGQTAQVPTKVGIVHIQNAILGTNEGQKALQEIEAKAAPKKKDLEKRQADILALQDQLNKMGNVGNDEQKQKLMRDIDQKKKAFTRDVDDAQADLDQENQKVLNDIGQRVMSVLDKYAKENGYSLILDVSNQQTSPVLFAANGTDVTGDVVKLFNASNLGSAPAPSGAAARPSATPTTPAARPAVPPARTTPPAAKPVGK